MTQPSKLFNHPQKLAGAFALAATTAVAAVMVAYRDNGTELNTQLKADIKAKVEENGFTIVGKMQDERGAFGSVNGCYTLSDNAEGKPTHSACVTASKRSTQLYSLQSLTAKH